MTTSYAYNVATSIPGGQLTADGVVSIVANILDNFSTQLYNLTHTRDNILTLIFTSPLTAMEQSLLDGYINRAGDYIDVIVDDIHIPFYLPVTLPSDGQIHLSVKLKCHKGDGSDRLDEPYPVVIKTNSLIKLNLRIGNLDPDTGELDFIIGPAHVRGTCELIIHVSNLPSRRLNVEFT